MRPKSSSISSSPRRPSWETIPDAELGGKSAFREKDRPEHRDGIGREAFLHHLRLHGFESDLVDFVYGDGDVNHPFREAADLGKSGEELAVVDFEKHPYIQGGEYLFHHLDKLQFAKLAAGADDIRIALVKLAVAAFLGTVGTPDGLDLETLEGETQLAAVLDDKTGEGDREVVAKSLFRGQGGFFTAVLDAVQEFVALFTVFAEKGAEVLHCGSLYLGISETGENALDGIENIIAPGHLRAGEVPGALWD